MESMTPQGILVIPGFNFQCLQWYAFIKTQGCFSEKRSKFQYGLKLMRTAEESKSHEHKYAQEKQNQSIFPFK